MTKRRRGDGSEAGRVTEVLGGGAEGPVAVSRVIRSEPRVAGAVAERIQVHALERGRATGQWGSSLGRPGTASKGFRVEGEGGGAVAEGREVDRRSVGTKPGFRGVSWSGLAACTDAFGAPPRALARCTRPFGRF